jgi:hypothetical protein
MHPHITSDEYNPLLHPEMYRSQALKNVNFYFSLLPWVEGGIVDIVRMPTDFDRELNWTLMEAQREKFEQDGALKEAAQKSAQELSKRHMKRMAYETLILGAPDDALRRMLADMYPNGAPLSPDEFIGHIQAVRDSNPNFLEPLGVGENNARIEMRSSGTHYGAAKIGAQLTGSYLVTDIAVKWKEIERDRQQAGAENVAWAPFAKSMQAAKLTYLDNLKLEHALTLRQEGRLESLRSFLHKVWRRACSTEAFDEKNSILLATELTDEIRAAEAEWSQIGRDLLKVLGTEFTAGLLAAGPLIAAGHAGFLAAAGVLGTGAAIAHGAVRRRRFQDNFPAAFFMRIAEPD